jgi:glutaredoxin
MRVLSLSGRGHAFAPGEGATMVDTYCALTFFSQQECGETKRVRQWLDAERIAYREIDASASEENARALLATGSFIAPMCICGPIRVVGFRPNALHAFHERCSHLG